MIFPVIPNANSISFDDSKAGSGQSTVQGALTEAWNRVARVFVYDSGASGNVGDVYKDATVLFTEWAKFTSGPKTLWLKTDMNLSTGTMSLDLSGSDLRGTPGDTPDGDEGVKTINVTGDDIVLTGLPARIFNASITLNRASTPLYTLGADDVGLELHDAAIVTAGAADAIAISGGGKLLLSEYGRSDLTIGDTGYPINITSGFLIFSIYDASSGIAAGVTGSGEGSSCAGTVYSTAATGGFVPTAWSGDPPHIVYGADDGRATCSTDAAFTGPVANAYTMIETVNHAVLSDPCTSAAQTVNLPEADIVLDYFAGGIEVTFIHSSTAAHNMILHPNGSDTINGSNSDLSFGSGSISSRTLRLLPDSGWWVVASF